MADDLAYLIQISVDEIKKCHRVMDIQELINNKIKQAHNELLNVLLPEVLKG